MKRAAPLLVLAAILASLAIWGGLCLRPPGNGKDDRERTAKREHPVSPKPGEATSNAEDASAIESPGETCSLVLHIWSARDRESVPGARIRLFDEEYPTRLLAEAVSDADGLATAVGLVPGRVVMVRVEATGFRFALERVTVAPDREYPRHIMLWRPISLCVEVRDAVTDTAVVGARITTHSVLWSQTGYRERLHRATPRDRGVSGSDGQVVFADAGRIVSAEAGGYAMVQKVLWGRVPESGLLIRLMPTGALVGRVTRPDGSPAPDALVTAGPADEWDPIPVGDRVRVRSGSGTRRAGRALDLVVWVRTRTDPEGRYRLPVSSGEACRIRAVAEGHRAGEEVVASVAPRGTKTVDLTLGRPVPAPPDDEEEEETPEKPVTFVTITGRVLDENGDPVPGARVSDRLGEGRETRTATDGTFSIRTRSAPWHRLVATAEGFHESTLVWEGGGPLQFRIERVVTVRVPVSVAPGEETPKRLSVEGDIHHGSRWYPGKWPDDGVLELVFKAKTSYVRLAASGFVPVTIPLKLRPGETLDLPEVRFERGATLRVRVVDDEDRALEGIRVEASQVNGNEQQGATDGEGCASIRGLRPGQSTLVVIEKTHYTGFRARVKPPHALEVRMVRHATIHGVVVDEHGIPVTAAGVRAFGPSAEEPVGRATADNAGRFLMRVPPGRYRLEISMPEGDSGDVLDGAWVVDARRETDPPLRIIVTRLR